MTPPARSQKANTFSSFIALHACEGSVSSSQCPKDSSVQVVAQHRHGTVDMADGSRGHTWRCKLEAVNLSFIRGRLQRSRSIYLDELRDEIASHRGKHISISTTWQTLQRINYSRKRVSGIARERKEL